MKNPKPTYKKFEVCDNCSPDWDRKGGVKRIVLCPIHATTQDLLKYLKQCVAFLDKEMDPINEWGNREAMIKIKAVIACAEGRGP